LYPYHFAFINNQQSSTPTDAILFPQLALTLAFAFIHRSASDPATLSPLSRVLAAHISPTLLNHNHALFQPAFPLKAKFLLSHTKSFGASNEQIYLCLAAKVHPLRVKPAAKPVARQSLRRRSALSFAPTSFQLPSKFKEIVEINDVVKQCLPKVSRYSALKTLTLTSIAQSSVIDLLDRSRKRGPVTLLGILT
jgi:hypothetical protein